MNDDEVEDCHKYDPHMQILVVINKITPIDAATLYPINGTTKNAIPDAIELENLDTKKYIKIKIN